MSYMTKGRIFGRLATKAHVADKSGLGEGTLVLTLDGEIPIEYLCVGDMVITRSGARSLAGISSRRIQSSIRIRNSSIGHDRPQTDLIISPEQCLHLRDWRASALFGTRTANVPAHRLVDGEFIGKATAGEAIVYRLEFTTPEVVYACGTEVAAAVAAPGTEATARH